MAYADEDEVDWSDSPLGPPSPETFEPDEPSSTLSPNLERCDDDDPPLVSDAFAEYSLPLGVPQNSASSNTNGGHPTISRLQCARIGVHLNRRLPTKEDYSNFALYQASQKAYEATFIKNFVAHALNPDQIQDCFQNGTNARANIDSYMKTISTNVNWIANKMVWNAHCRVVNLLAKDGKESAPFLDVHAFDSSVFSDFGPGSSTVLARKMNESWHRAEPKPPMVRLTTKDYPLGRHCAPLEELDEVTNTLFQKEAFGSALPRGRATRPPTAKKGQGYDSLGAAIRESNEVASRGNWLAFPSLDRSAEQLNQAPINFSLKKGPNRDEIAQQEEDHYTSVDSHNLQQTQRCDLSIAGCSMIAPEIPPACSTRIQEPFVRYSSPAPNCDTADLSVQILGEDLVEKVPCWRMKLIQDHKRRLTARGNPSQTIQRALPGIKQAIANAIAKGCRPTSNNHIEDVEKIAAREQTRSVAHTKLPAVFTQSSQNALMHMPFLLNDDLKDKTWAMGGVDFTGRVDEFAEDIEREGWGNRVRLAQSNQSKESPKKKRKINEPAAKSTATKITPKRKATSANSSAQDVNRGRCETSTDRGSSPSHPSGSKTLEPHQRLPPDAYFEPISIDEEPVWRCGLKHAMGHYYNAGNRKSCRGCNTSRSDNPKMVKMDFYLPSWTFFYQSVPGLRWRPPKPSAKLRKSGRPCHNAVAKDAYWAAISIGATEEEAHQTGVDAVTQYLQPRPKPRKEPTSEPTLEPEPDLAPHPSGSATMEHGQDLPESAYTTKQERCEDFAWRCDVNHALGRYYLAGDKKSCPGCGTNKGGAGKQTMMDFFLPPSTVVRQKAPNLVKWKPRKYKGRSTDSVKSGKAKHSSHNQMCAEKYFATINQGREEELEAMKIAVDATNAYLEAKQEEVAAKDKQRDESNDSDEESSAGKISTTASSETKISPGYGTRFSASASWSSVRTHSRKGSTDTSQSCGSPEASSFRRHSRGGCTMSLVPKKRDFKYLRNDEIEKLDDVDELEDYITAAFMKDEVNQMDATMKESSSSVDSSESDSE